MPTWEEQQLCIGATFRVAATNGADASRRVAIEGFCQSVDYLLASVQVGARRATCHVVRACAVLVCEKGIGAKRSNSTCSCLMDFACWHPCGFMCGTTRAFSA